MVVSRREAFRFWLKLGFISFGGPAGQIAIMHREVVERRRWIGDGPFMHALNFCMLLPGPEALQLAIWLGWRLHGVAGGIVAGLCFILPAMTILLALSFLYALHGTVPAVAAVLTGLQATVIALIAQALVRLARRALTHPLHWLLAAAALVLMVGRIAPFPLLLAGAALAGMLVTRDGNVALPREPVSFPWRSLGAGIALWTLPAVLVVALAGSDSLFADIYRFFTTAALVTFGGAYAVLAWVTQQAVEVHGWLTQAQAVAGLALAETTPGPLIIVLQFIGFMAGWNAAAGVDAAATATTAAALTAWATFLPSFIFILVGAPYVERLSSNRRLAGALAGVTAAVVGVIGSLAIIFGRGVLFPEGLEDPAWRAIAIAVLAFVLLERTRVDVLWVIAGGAIAGLVLGMA
ncbi:MAG: chromate efflux transporter [Pseudomonadota bacterium]|nr:chromate efflux transporter [Pseudomonadota bacterium]